MFLPSFGNNFARHSDESKVPDLWYGLQGMWLPLLGSTGTVLYDWSGKKRHGTLTNMEPGDWLTSANNKYGKSLSFGGTDEHVALGNIDILSDNGGVTRRGVTIDVAFCIDSFPGGVDQRFVSKASSGSAGDHYWMVGATGTDLRSRISDDAGQVLTSVSLTLSTAVWYHVTVIWYVSTVSSIRHFVNGIEQGTSTSGNFPNDTVGLRASSSVAAEIGRNPGASPTGAMVGKIAWVRLWNYGFTPAQVIRLASNPFEMLERKRVVKYFAVQGLSGSAGLAEINLNSISTLGLGVNEAVGIGGVSSLILNVPTTSVSLGTTTGQLDTITVLLNIPQHIGIPTSAAIGQHVEAIINLNSISPSAFGINTATGITGLGNINLNVPLISSSSGELIALAELAVLNLNVPQQGGSGTGSITSSLDSTNVNLSIPQTTGSGVNTTIGSLNGCSINLNINNNSGVGVGTVTRNCGTAIITLNCLDISGLASLIGSVNVALIDLNALTSNYSVSGIAAGSVQTSIVNLSIPNQLGRGSGEVSRASDTVTINLSIPQSQASGVNAAIRSTDSVSVILTPQQVQGLGVGTATGIGQTIDVILVVNDASGSAVALTGTLDVGILNLVANAVVGSGSGSVTSSVQAAQIILNALNITGSLTAEQLAEIIKFDLNIYSNLQFDLELMDDLQFDLDL